LTATDDQAAPPFLRAEIDRGASVPPRTAEDDRRDAVRVIAGEAAAFEGIVRRWQSPLINLAYRFCRDRARAEEMAQEAFLRAYRNLSSWRQESAFSTWLFSLATNLYCSEIRRLPPVTLPFEDVMEPADPRAFHSEVEERQQRAAVRQAVAGLPAKYREVLTLYYFHEMDVPGAAASLGLPEGTVKVRLFRARNLLRAKLSHMNDRPAMPDPQAKEST
jgi:RNA polymerase sigma-70 factor, ECF subfamily